MRTHSTLSPATIERCAITVIERQARIDELGDCDQNRKAALEAFEVLCEIHHLVSPLPAVALRDWTLKRHDPS